MSNLRLDKYLADMQIGTRSEVKNYIKKRMVSINGSVAVRPEQKVDVDNDSITFQGKMLTYVKYEYYMLHKPSGFVSATKDNINETVVSLIPATKEIFPVGRLDKDTEGLLLLTNDGELAHNLLSPKKHVPKTYFAKVEGHVTNTDIECFLQGIDIGDETITLPAQLKIMESGAISQVYITISEGRYHQIKRMFQAIDKRVIYLKRISMGSLTLDDNLRIGEYRKLTDIEVEQLTKMGSEMKGYEE